MRREIPIILTVVFLLVRFVFLMVGPLYDYSVPLPDGTQENLYTRISYAVTQMTVMAMFMGLWNLTRVHLGNIQKRRENWPYSVWLIAVLWFYTILGIVEPGIWGAGASAKIFDWIYDAFIVPLDSTTFSLLAFFIASAAYRAFRVRSIESALLMVVAFIIMLGNTSIGMAIWKGFPVWKTWLMNIPNAAGYRAINIGLFVGAYVTTLRVALGIERRYLGQD